MKIYNYTFHLDRSLAAKRLCKEIGETRWYFLLLQQESGVHRERR